MQQSSSKESKNISGETIKWIFLSVLIVVVILVVLIVQTPKSTSAIESGSTLLSCLAGHWKDINGNGEIWYSFVDPQLKIGTYRLRNMPYEEFGPPFQFKVLKEYPFEKKIILRTFNNKDLMELEALTGYDFSKSDIICCISKDGQTMSQEYVHISSGDHIFTIYQYVGE